VKTTYTPNLNNYRYEKKNDKIPQLEKKKKKQNKKKKKNPKLKKKKKKQNKTKHTYIHNLVDFQLKNHIFPKKLPIFWFKKSLVITNIVGILFYG